MSEKAWSRTKRVPFDVYGCHVDVVICNDLKLCFSDVKKHYECDISDVVDFKGLSSQGKKGAFIIFELESRSEIVSHECFHSASNMLDYRYVRFVSGDCNEAWAYAIGYLTGIALDFQAECRAEHQKKPKAKK